MRELKFRVWITESKSNWNEDDDFDWDNRMRQVSSIHFPLDSPSGKHITCEPISDNDHYGSGWFRNKWLDINRIRNEETVIMQFTGLKDKNGKEIYEGDLLIDREADEFGNDISSKLPVVFCNETLQWCVDNSYAKDSSHLVNLIEYLDIENLEVVGNIYENPEMLNVAQ